MPWNRWKAKHIHGRVRQQTCTHLCVYFYFPYAFIQISVDAHALWSCPSPSTPTVDTLVASRQHHPCSLIPPSSPAHYHNTEKKLPESLICTLPGHKYRCYSLLSLLLSVTLDIFSVQLLLLNTTVKLLLSSCTSILLRM